MKIFKLNTVLLASRIRSILTTRTTYKKISFRIANFFNYFRKLNILGLVQAALVILMLLGITLSIRGNLEKNGILSFQYLNSSVNSASGTPFEVSISSGRYALTHALGERGSVIFSTEEASFASPDVVKGSHGYASVFMPGVSLLSLPLYLLGKYFQLPQLMSFLTGTVFLLINVLLLFKIGEKFGFSTTSKIISALTLALASNALAYSSLMTQHVPTICILYSILLVFLSKISLIKKNILLALLYAMSFYLDFPNLIIFSPFVLYLLGENLWQGVKKSIQYQLTFFICLIIFLLPLFAYNHFAYGKWSTLGQVIGNTSDFVKPSSSPYKNLSTDYFTSERNKKSVFEIMSLPFNTRHQITSTYTLLLSIERAWWYYSPILLFGFVGIYYFYKSSQNKQLLIVMLGMMLFNITLYSTFGDAWGGWAFGARYLLPSAAILAIFVPLSIKKYKSLMFDFSVRTLFFLALCISIAFNTLGAFTTTAIPPKVEALNLIKETAWNMDLPFNLLLNNKTSSLLINILSQESKITLSSVYYLYLRYLFLTLAMVIYAPFLSRFFDKLKFPKNVS